MTAYLIVALVFCGLWWCFSAVGTFASDDELGAFCAINVLVLTLAIIGLGLALA